MSVSKSTAWCVLQKASHIVRFKMNLCLRLFQKHKDSLYEFCSAKYGAVNKIFIILNLIKSF